MPAHILIAEDDRALSHALELKLKHEGFTVDVAYDGLECLELIKKPHDMLLLDLMMPGFDGFQVLTAMKENGDTTPVFILSNLSQHEDEERTLALGAKRYFVKSNTPLSDIVEAIKEQLKK
ncbi:MAG TPA: response regulator [Candidatus Saccharimonadales bacterium]